MKKTEAQKGKKELTKEEEEALKVYYKESIEMLTLQKTYKQLLFDIRELSVKNILLDLKLTTDESIKKGG
jgi:hypothetical protein